MGGHGTATVVVAQPDPPARELLARIVEAIGQNAVRLDVTDPPVLVDTTVESSALAVVVDVTALGFADLDAVVGAFATRRYPAQVLGLVDGPASAATALSAGAAVVLERPFHRDDFVRSLADLLGVGIDLSVFDPPQPEPDSGSGSDEPTPDDSELAQDQSTGDIVEEDSSGVSAAAPVHDEPDDDEPDDEPSDEIPEEDALTEGAPLDGLDVEDTNPVDDELVEDAPADDELAGAQPTDDELVKDEPADDEPADDQAGNENPRPVGVDHSFTDILKMGRQL